MSDDGAAELTPEELLDAGVDVWNKWRDDHPAKRPSLSGVDASDRELTGINLSELDLSGADFYGSDLSGANLKMANLSDADLGDCKLVKADLYKVDLRAAFATGADFGGAYLNESDLRGTDLRGVKLVEASLKSSDLTGADLTQANLTGANLDEAVLIGADMSRASLEATSLFRVSYGSFESMRGHYFGIRGLDSCFGNALFVRDAKDRDYLDAFERAIELAPQGRAASFRKIAFRAWRMIDYGRSMGKPLLYAVILSMIFGTLYTFDLRLGWGLMDYSNSSGGWFTPFYYSIVTYTTLGFGDITPLNWVGEIIVVVEVIMGYTTLGLVLAILANRVARQS
jgi:hypothetical protein